MKRFYARSKALAVLAACSILMITTTGFRESSSIRQIRFTPVFNDTVPENSIHIDIDMKDLDKAMKDLDKALKEIEWDKISKDIEASLKEIDMNKINKDIAISLQSIDWKKIQNEIDESVKNIDLAKIDIDIKNAINDAKIDFNSEEFKKSMEAVKKINMKEITEELKKVKIELEKNKDRIKIDIRGAQDEIKKARAGLEEIKEMTGEMEKDKLLNIKEGYTIEYKNQELFINGKKQSEGVAGKYRKYFKGENFKLERKKEN